MVEMVETELMEETELMGEMEEMPEIFLYVFFFSTRVVIDVWRDKHVYRV